VVTQGSPEQLKRELSGDTVFVELVENDHGTAQTSLSGVAGLASVEVNGRALRARTGNGAAVLPALLAALDAHDVKVASVKVSRPSLDEVYLRHAGRAFDEAESGASGVPA
jgi:ABC-2 type transport system ATP-binding protein